MHSRTPLAVTQHLPVAGDVLSRIIKVAGRSRAEPGKRLHLLPPTAASERTRSRTRARTKSRTRARRWRTRARWGGKRGKRRCHKQKREEKGGCRRLEYCLPMAGLGILFDWQSCLIGILFDWQRSLIGIVSDWQKCVQFSGRRGAEVGRRAVQAGRIQCKESQHGGHGQKTHGAWSERHGRARCCGRKGGGHRGGPTQAW